MAPRASVTMSNEAVEPERLVRADEQVGGEDADEEEGRAGEGVQEELRGRVATVRATAVDDHEIARDEGDLEGHEEQESVQRQERGHAGRLEQEHPAQVGPLGALPGRAGHGDREQQGRHGDEEQRNAVHAQVPGDVQRPEPGLPARELETSVGVAGLERDDHPEHEAELEHRRPRAPAAWRTPPEGVRQEGHDQGGPRGRKTIDVEDREAHGSAPGPEGRGRRGRPRADADAERGNCAGSPFWTLRSARPDRPSSAATPLTKPSTTLRVHDEGQGRAAHPERRRDRGRD